MADAVLSQWLLEREARALLTRLRRVRPFALQETMVPAAALSPAAQIGIERYLIDGRAQLEAEIVRYLRWLRARGRSVSPEEQQRRFTLIRLRFNLALSQLDLFSDVVTQRSEHRVGVWLSGLDVAAADALNIGSDYLRPPPVVCYLHRGLGGAIRRAHTRLPGGGENPVAIIRIPRERMIGYGIASSLVHEVGHQAASLLGLVESLRPVIQAAGRESDPSAWRAWTLFAQWISEVIADVFSIARVGVASTMGLIGLVSLPRAFIFRISADDPHPFAWIRVHISCAFGDAMYPNPQWNQLRGVWNSYYPIGRVPSGLQATVRALLQVLPSFVQLVLSHRPAGLGGRPIGDVFQTADRTPERLDRLWSSSRGTEAMLGRLPPSLAFAVVGHARARGVLTPEREDQVLGKLITRWALDSTLRTSAEIVALQDRGIATGGATWLAGQPLSGPSQPNPDGLPGGPGHDRVQPQLAIPSFEGV